MKCEICKKKRAEVTIRQVVDQEERELFVCQDCAHRSAGEWVTSLVEMLLGATIDLRIPEREEGVCAGCGMSRAEFRKRTRVGCSRCYETFARELAPMLREMHSGDQHVGKVPAQERRGRERARLEGALKEAVRTQRYEDAALLRDRIRNLEAAAKPAGKEPADASA